MSRRLLAISVVALLASLLFSVTRARVAASARSYYVDALHGNNRTGDGSAAKPWRTITRALHAVSAGDRVTVRAGTYDQALGESFPMILPPGVSLLSVGSDRTIIAGQSGRTVLSVGNGTQDFPGTTRVVSLTLTGGSIGLEMYSSQQHTVSPVIDRLCIRQNGTGIHMSTGAPSEDGATIVAVITGTVVMSNSLDGISMTSYGHLSPSKIAPVITNCLVLANGHCGLYIEADAVVNGNSASYAAPELYRCRILGNGGDGVHATASYQAWCRPRLENCSITDNGSNGLGWWPGYGSGNIDAVLASMLVARNHAGGLYVGLAGSGSTWGIHVLNCTLAGNAGYGIYWDRGSHEAPFSVVNSILWNADADDLVSTGAPWTTDQVQYCDIEDGDLVGQLGNIRENPRLTADYHLTACSPAMNAGTSTAAPVMDLDGEPRPQGAAPDIGADEYEVLCQLQVDKTVSQADARYSNILTYTIDVTNHTVITPLAVLVTDVLPTCVAYLPGSLDVSQGSAACASGVLTWSGTLDPQSAASIGLQTRFVVREISATNTAMASAEGAGTVTSLACRTNIQNDYYVDALYGDDIAGDGTPASPWRTITRALGAATRAGDLVIVRAGTYNQDLGEVFPIVLPPGVSLLGEGCDTTIIAGQGDKPVLSIGNKTQDFPRTTGGLSLTLTGGSIGLEMYSSRLHAVSPTIDSLCIRQNTTGIRMSTGETSQHGATIMPVITGTKVISNSQDGINMYSNGYYSPSGIAPVITNCVVQANGGRGLYVYAYAANPSYAAPRLYGCRIDGNGGDGLHAAALYLGWSRPYLENCWITDNGGYGMAWPQGASGGFEATLANVVVAANRAGGLRIGQHGSYGQGSTLRVLNCTLTGNSGYGICWERGAYEVPLSVVNTILWNADADDLYSTGDPWTTTQVQYCDIEDGDFYGQQGNFSDDPRLTEDYHLSLCSPAMNAGTAAGAPLADIDGEPRPQGPAPDIGADEYEALCPLQLDKTVSEHRARIGDALTYAINLTNTTAISPLAVLLTDVLPISVAYVPGSLYASQGSAACTSGVVTWSSTLAPQAVASITVQTRATGGGASALNVATASTGGLGTIASRICRIDIYDPHFLPIVMRTDWSCPFLDDFTSSSSGWPVEESSLWSYGYLNGEYRMYAKRGRTLAAVTNGGVVEPMAVEVDAHQASSVYGALGLVYGVNADWRDFYTFEIHPTYRLYAVFHYYRGGWHLLSYGTPKAINSGQGGNRLRVRWEAKKLYFEVKGEILYSYAAPSPISGRVGLVAEASKAGFDARFDNFEMVPVGCPDYTAAAPAPGSLRNSIEMTRPWQRGE